MPTPANVFGISFQKGSTISRPIPAAGNLIDATIGQDLSAIYPALAQDTVITLGGTTATGDVTTLTITPLRTQTGSPFASGIVPVVASFTTGATETLAAVAAGLAAKLTTDSKATLATLATYSSSIRKILRAWSAAGDDLTLNGRDGNAAFAYELTSTGNVTATDATTGGTLAPLNIGIVIVKDGHTSDNYLKVKAPEVRSVSADIVGVSRDGGGAEPTEAGYAFKQYRRGSMVPYRSFGTVSVYGEKACAAGADVWVRNVAAPGKTPGAVTDTDGGEHIQMLGAKFIHTTTGVGPQAIHISHL